MGELRLEMRVPPAPADWYYDRMATATRIQVTKTGQLTEALQAAQEVWPDEKHASRLVERLAVVGARHLVDTEPAQQRRDHIEAALAPAATRFPDDYLATVRQGWA